MTPSWFWTHHIKDQGSRDEPASFLQPGLCIKQDRCIGCKHLKVRFEYRETQQRQKYFAMDARRQYVVVLRSPQHIKISKESCDVWHMFL